jgi:tRNA threonylcarbamoyladenosine biosynthesis protein TsaE
VGKTTFVKGIARALHIREEITSPSFTIMTVYQGRLPLYHIDLYRLEDSDEIEDLGIEEFLYGDGVSVIEWGERAMALLPKDRIEVSLSLIQGGLRQMEIRGIEI